MKIKGKNQHVMPNDTGWCVVDEASQRVKQHFNTREEAMEYAQKCASAGEGEVLLHTSPCADTQNLSSVALPQREYFPGQGYVDMGEASSMSATTSGQKASPGRKANSSDDTGYDPLLGYEEYFYDL